MRSGFWREADEIIKASRASHPGYRDYAEARQVAEARERRRAETDTAPSAGSAASP